MAKCENCYYAGVCKDYPDTGVPPEIKCELIFAIFRLLEASSDSECAPAADVEPVRRGVWELDYDRNFHRCSNCKESSIRYTDECGYEIDEELTNFCPECGAKMDGGE